VTTSKNAPGTTSGNRDFEPSGPFSSEVPSLLQSHFEALHQGSGISVELIRERGYRSVTTNSELAMIGFKPAQRNPPGMLMPVHTSDGAAVKLNCYRPDYPRVVRGKELKYEFPRGESMRIDVPPRCLPNLKNPHVPLWITEGQKKADALASHGLCAIDLLGVWNFKGRNEFGAVTVLVDLDFIAWDGREVYIVFDSDIMSKRPVQMALERFTEILERKGARNL
jgi:hypothetical protein